MTPADQADFLGSWHLGGGAGSSDSADATLGRHASNVNRTFGESSASDSSPSDPGPPIASSSLTESGSIPDVQRRAAESQAVVKVHAVSDDGSKSCSFEFDASLGRFADFQARIADRLKLQSFVCTYSTSPQFLAMRSVNPYRQQMLTSDLELSCAVMSTSVGEAPQLYVRAHQNLAGDLLSASRPRLRSNSTATPSGEGWDLMEDSQDVLRLWRKLPAAANVPFARLLLCHQRQPLNQVARTVQGIALRLPLQTFEWDSFQDAHGRVVREADFRLRVYHGGIAPALRTTAWRHILYVFPPHLTSEEREEFLDERRREYFQLRSAWKDAADRAPSIEALMTMINNDVIRTDRRLPCFAADDSPYLKSLFNILVTFALNDAVISYVQGLNDIAGIVLQVYNGDEADAYIAFHGFMRCSRTLFTPDGLSQKSGHLTALLQRFDSVFYDYLCETRSEDLFFTYRWLLLDLKREFEVADVLRLFEVLWATLPPPNQYLSSLHSPTPDVPSSKSSAVSTQSTSPDIVVVSSEDHPDITLSDYGSSSPAGAWAVIDCVSQVDECAVSEVAESSQRDVQAMEEASDATLLSESQASQPDDAAILAQSLPTAGWDVVGAQEAEVTEPEITALVRATSSGFDEVSPPGAVEPVVHGDAIPMHAEQPVATRSDPIPMRPAEPAAEADNGAAAVVAEGAELSPFYAHGSPFTLFVCLALILERRSYIMQNHVVEEGIAIYFDKQRGQHDLGTILDKARALLLSYVTAELDGSPPASPPKAPGLM